MGYVAMVISKEAILRGMGQTGKLLWIHNLLLLQLLASHYVNSLLGAL
jgi:hypothetical protein